ncbi:LapA family protein [Helcobacillus massiliensis]|uniref:Putative integral membrane protein n=1 Tax=Helcobacillus massiliensis TaxID=521392 RepID=A0A839QW81_9MICO|nr:hypothetical protein [Helcobacillus massiliensis]MBB3023955.1 putative integral membrane protein [Helcobacillus massiliensis]
MSRSDDARSQYDHDGAFARGEVHAQNRTAPEAGGASDQPGHAAGEPRPGREPEVRQDSPARRTPDPAAFEPVEDTRNPQMTARLIIGLAVGGIILAALLAFVLQNPDAQSFAFLSWHFTLASGVAMLLAAVLGGLIVAAIASILLAQQAWRLRKMRKSNDRMRSAMREAQRL